MEHTFQERKRHAMVKKSVNQHMVKLNRNVKTDVINIRNVIFTSTLTTSGASCTKVVTKLALLVRWGQPTLNAVML